MDTPTSPSTAGSDATSTDADSLVRDGAGTLRIRRDDPAGRTGGYSILVRGEVRSSSVLSTADPGASITLLEDDTRLLSGTVGGETLGFVLDGHVLAAGFDDPQPTVSVDGESVDPDRWPTVKEYTGYGPGQDPVEDPFPDGGELGAPRGDPLKGETYVVELDASGTAGPEAYCLDVDGDVVDRSDGVTVTEAGDRVYGCLAPDRTARLELRGVVTRIETADGIDFSVRPSEESEITLAD